MQRPLPRHATRFGPACARCCNRSRTSNARGTRSPSQAPEVGRPILNAAITEPKCVWARTIHGPRLQPNAPLGTRRTSETWFAHVVCRAARGRAADRRRAAPRGTRLSEKPRGGHAAEDFSKNSVVRRSCSGGIFQKKEATQERNTELLGVRPKPIPDAWLGDDNPWSTRIWFDLAPQLGYERPQIFQSVFVARPDAHPQQVAVRHHSIGVTGQHT